MTELAQFLSCRDLLLTHRTDYEAAVKAFKWPVLEHFNWALDYFDSIARETRRQPCTSWKTRGSSFG